MLRLNVYSKRHIDFNRLVQSIDIDLCDNNIGIGINQIIAEKNSPLSSRHSSKISQRLHDIHETKWIKIDDLGFYDAKEQKINYSALYLSEGKTKNPRLDIVINFNNDDRKLLPLFRHIAHFIMANVQSEICIQYGAFGEATKLVSKSNNTRLIDNLRMGLSKPDIKDINSTVKDTLIVLSKNMTYDRLIEEIKNTKYARQPYYTKEIENTYIDTLCIVGSRGWKEIATKDNLQKILDNTKIEIHYAKQRSNISLDSNGFITLH